MKKELTKKVFSLILTAIFVSSCAFARADTDIYATKIHFLQLICEKAKVSPLLYEGGFTDIEPGSPYAEIVAGALKDGIIDSVFADGEGRFEPMGQITNEEAVAMMVGGLIKMKNDLSVGIDLDFEDKDDISPEFLTYIEVAAANGVIENSGMFYPKKAVGALQAEKMADAMYESYRRLPVLPGSGIRRIQFPVIENADIKPPEFLEEGYELVFDDEFEGDALDTSKWGYNYSWGHSHNHAAWCVPENVTVADGILTLKGENAKHPDSEGKQGTFNNKKYDIVYTSGAINTHHKYNFDYGYFEARLKMPAGKGMWPAWWMLRDGWPPEIDMLEILCSRPNELHVNFHYGPSWNEHYSHEQVLDVGFDASEQFHTYGFEWTPKYMRYYVDGVQVGHDFTNKSAIKEARGMYMILNLAIDGWDGAPDKATQWPALFQCDYVRVWQMNE